MECAGHKGVILHGVGKHHQLGAAEATAVFCQLRRFFDDLPHAAHRVHINTRPGAAYVHAGAHQVRFRQRLGNGIDQHTVAVGTALLHQRRKAAHKIYSAVLCGFVQCLGNGYERIGFA